MPKTGLRTHGALGADADKSQGCKSVAANISEKNLWQPKPIIKDSNIIHGKTNIIKNTASFFLSSIL